MVEANYRGGPRPGAGRKSGSGPYGEPTCPLRIPVSQVEVVRAYLERRQVFRPAFGERCPRPLYGSKVRAGFPSPADDHLDRQLDLNEHLIRRPEATFFVYAQGDSMIGEGIHDGDLLIVDRAEAPVHGKIVIAIVNGEFTVKKLAIRGQQIFLESGNPDYAPIPIKEEAGLEVWGVVTNVIRKV